MVVDIIVLVFGCIVKGKIVMVSGDVDMILVIKKSLEMEWFIEIWMWKNSVLNLLRKLVEKNLGFMSINIFDLCLEEVRFINFIFD